MNRPLEDRDFPLMARGHLVYGQFDSSALLMTNGLDMAADVAARLNEQEAMRRRFPNRDVINMGVMTDWGAVEMPGPHTLENIFTKQTSHIAAWWKKVFRL